MEFVNFFQLVSQKSSPLPYRQKEDAKKGGGNLQVTVIKPSGIKAGIFSVIYVINFFLKNTGVILKFHEVIINYIESALLTHSLIKVSILHYILRYFLT